MSRKKRTLVWYKNELKMYKKANAVLKEFATLKLQVSVMQDILNGMSDNMKRLEEVIKDGS